jgi:hypothetical protein
MSLGTEDRLVDLDQIRLDYESAFHDWASAIELLHSMEGADAESIALQRAHIAAAEAHYRTCRELLAEHLLYASEAA